MNKKLFSWLTILFKLYVQLSNISTTKNTGNNTQVSMYANPDLGKLEQIERSIDVFGQEDQHHK